MPTTWNNPFPSGLFGTQNSPANPADPNQQLQWASGETAAANRQLQNLNLFDPQVLSQLQKILGPLFSQQRQNFQQGFGTAFNTATSDAARNASALAAFKGYNPSSFINTARQNVAEQMTPGFFSGLAGLGENQQQALLNAASGSQQFRAGNLNQIANRWAQQIPMWGQMSYEQANAPSFGDYLGAGLFGLGGSLLGGPFGGALGASIFGK